MNSWETWFRYSWMLSLLGLTPLLALLGGAAARRRRRAARTFTGGRPLAVAWQRRRRLRATCGLLGLTMLVVGLAGPRWGRDPDAPPALGRDLLVVLDLSRSMLAEAPPRSRLTRAKKSLDELTDTLKRRGGYRLGLIAFARQARLLCPLTEDYDHFRYVVEQAHPLGFGGVVRLGDAGEGTRLRPALELAVRTLDADSRPFQDILVVSDGDDLAGDWDQGADAARQAGLRVHTLAVGDPKEAARIPWENGYLQYRGEFVQTRRHDEVLRRTAELTGGVFLPEEAAAAPLVHWFQTTIRPLPLREWTDDGRPLHTEQFGWFFAGALACLILEMLLSDVRRRREED